MIASLSSVVTCLGGKKGICNKGPWLEFNMKITAETITQSMGRLIEIN